MTVDCLCVFHACTPTHPRDMFAHTHLIVSFQTQSIPIISRQYITHKKDRDSTVKDAYQPCVGKCFGNYRSPLHWVTDTAGTWRLNCAHYLNQLYKFTKSTYMQEGTGTHSGHIVWMNVERSTTISLSLLISVYILADMCQEKEHAKMLNQQLVPFCNSQAVQKTSQVSLYCTSVPLHESWGSQSNTTPCWAAAAATLS